MSNFELSSPDFGEQDALSKLFEFNGSDGSGKNISPALSWQGAPQEAKSFAITIYDPDAPTGSGFWHWVLYDIPASIVHLAQGVGSVNQPELTGIGKQAQNDFGTIGFGGPCPPKGDKAHRYIFTIHALSVDSLGLPLEGVTNAGVRFMIYHNTLATASLTGLYQRG